MATDTGKAHSMSSGETNAEARRAALATRIVATAWGLAGVAAALAMPGTLKAGILLIPIAVACLRWPRVLRWPMFAFVVLAPLGLLALAHGYFHARTSYPLLIWACCGISGHALLLFGRMTVARLALGGVAFLASLVGARFVLPASAPAPEICEARVNALSQRMNAYLATRHFAFQPQQAKLPRMPGRAPATADYRIFEVTPTGTWFGKHLFNQGPQAAAQLRSFVAYTRARASDQAQPVGLYVAADADTPVSKLAELFAPLTNVHVALLGMLDTGPLGSVPPSAKALADELDSAPSDGERARIAASELGQRAGPCSPLAKQLVQLNDLPAEARPAFLAKALDQGLRQCQCGLVDIDALEYLSMRLLGASPHDFGAVPLPNDETGGPVVPAEPALTVQEWIQRL